MTGMGLERLAEMRPELGVFGKVAILNIIALHLSSHPIAATSIYIVFLKNELLVQETAFAPPAMHKEVNKRRRKRRKRRRRKRRKHNHFSPSSMLYMISELQN